MQTMQNLILWKIENIVQKKINCNLNFKLSYSNTSNFFGWQDANKKSVMLAQGSLLLGKIQS